MATLMQILAQCAAQGMELHSYAFSLARRRASRLERAQALLPIPAIPNDKSRSID